MQQIATRAELESRLKRAALRLLARQVVRAAFSGVAGAAFGLALGVVFLELLPRALFAYSAGGVALAAVSAAGFVFGMSLEWRRYRMPTLQDAALALESRLDNDTGALAAALRVDEASSFYRPVLARATGELHEAEQASAPELISTRRLVLVPLFALAVGVAVVAVMGMKPPPTKTGIAGVLPTDSESRQTWNNIDVGGDRTAADSSAYREAMGMEEVATTLNNSATTLRDAEATRDSKQQALADAREAADSVDVEAVGLSPTDLPAELPDDAETQAELADKIMSAAAGLSAKADSLRKDGKAGATEDSGTNGKFDVSDTSREFVTLPALKIERSELAPKSLAAQTPARRAMASRAMQSLARIQER